jgi:hypothetical protein
MVKSGELHSNDLGLHGEKEGVGILLIREWINEVSGVLASYGLEAKANIRTVFKDINRLAADWISDRSANELQSLFLISLRLVGFEIHSWRTDDLHDKCLIIVDVGGKQIGGSTDQTAILRTKNVSLDNQANESVWTHLTELSDANSESSPLSIQRILMALASYIFANEFLEQQREYLPKLDSVSAQLSFDYYTRVTIMREWNNIQRGIDGRFQI